MFMSTFKSISTIRKSGSKMTMRWLGWHVAGFYMQDAWRMATQRHGRRRGDTPQPQPVEITNWKHDKPANKTTLSKKDPSVMSEGGMNMEREWKTFSLFQGPSGWEKTRISICDLTSKGVLPQKDKTISSLKETFYYHILQGPAQT